MKRFVASALLAAAFSLTACGGEEAGGDEGGRFLEEGEEVGGEDHDHNHEGADHDHEGHDHAEGEDHDHDHD